MDNNNDFTILSELEDDRLESDDVSVSDDELNTLLGSPVVGR